jgi:hypothetical protein
MVLVGITLTVEQVVAEVITEQVQAAPLQDQGVLTGAQVVEFIAVL